MAFYGSLKLCTRLTLKRTKIKSSFCDERYKAICTFCKLDKSRSDFGTALFVPIPMKPVTNNPDDINIGEELCGKLEKEDLLTIINTFYKQPQIKQISEENGLDTRLFHEAIKSFRHYCLESRTLPTDLHVACNDILHSAGHVNDLLPYFLRHARQIFPHLECMEDLKKISDLRLPANWYPDARAINRKIVFHAGPTNSGKTYHALQRFINAKSGVYCGPLKLLAMEVHDKCNASGTPCDLVTGEERRFANADNSPAGHLACTVEMTSVTTPYEVAIIDEIQMLRDVGRGWSWTRALLGVAAKEIHLCGEVAAIELVKELCLRIGETVEVRKYKRLTKLTVEDNALEQLDNVTAGDCIVCFNKNDIYNVSRQIEKQKKEVAVIYGGLPPGTKIAQANKFNDPEDPCKILVATDAIGMGLNLSIRRIIFFSLLKPNINEKGEKEIEAISTSQALQIAGRAGRYGTQFSEGFVTTYRKEDLPMLKSILGRTVNDIEAAGLHPTADQIELFGFHLPHATLSNIIDIFVSLCVVDDSKYFLCNVEDFKFLADMIEHVPLQLRVRYVFCCAPINRKMPIVCSMFLKFARQYSKNEPITFDWLFNNMNMPLVMPNTIAELLHLEAVFDVLDLYLWLSYRFTDLFPNADMVRGMQHDLDNIIQMGVQNITRLLKNTEKSPTPSTSNSADDRPWAIKGKTDSYSDENQFSRFNQSSTKKIMESTLPKHRTRTASVSECSSVEKDNYLYGHGKIAEQLIRQGIISEELLVQLRNEFEKSPSATPNQTRRGKKTPKPK